MSPTRTSPDACAALEAASGQLSELLHAMSTSDIPLEDSMWTVRDAAAHLICLTTLYSELAAGARSPIPEFTPESVARFNKGRIADIGLSEPAALAKSLAAATEEFVESTARRSDTAPVTFHGDLPLTVGQLVGFLLGEYLLHGYDITRAAGTPWPIDTAHTLLVLQAYTPLFPQCVDSEAARGVTASYLLRLGQAGTVIARFIDGSLHLEPRPEDDGDDETDCVITADPTAFLLISNGRLSPWTAIALGLLSASGRHPERAMTFTKLFYRF